MIIGDENFADDILYFGYNQKIEKYHISSSSQTSVLSTPESRLSEFELQMDGEFEKDSESADEETTFILSLNLFLFLVSYLSFCYYSIASSRIK